MNLKYLTHQIDKINSAKQDEGDAHNYMLLLEVLIGVISFGNQFVNIYQI